MELFNPKEIDLYLSRLHLGRQEASLSYLCYLQENHLLTIPFENLDVMDHKHIQLAVPELFDKIITHNRGGFCFELNGLFCQLLRSLGFQVQMIEAAVYNRKLQAFGFMRNHMALIVIIKDIHYLVDVGFGDSFRTPLSLNKKATEDVSGKYRIRHIMVPHHRLGNPFKIEEKFDNYVLEQNTGDEWVFQYKFHYDRYLQLEEYQENCDWIESSPESGFTKGRTWTIAKKDGRISLSEFGITITKYLEKTKSEFDEIHDFEYNVLKYSK